MRLSRLSRGCDDILRGEARVELEADERRRRAASISMRHGRYPPLRAALMPHAATAAATTALLLHVLEGA